MTRFSSRLALLAATVAMAGCCHDYPSRSYAFDAPDPDLQPMLQACVDTRCGNFCISPACRAACIRVVQLAGDPLGDELTDCQVFLGDEANARAPGAAAVVYVGSKSCGL